MFVLTASCTHPLAPADYSIFILLSSIHGWCNYFKWPCSVKSKEHISINYVSNCSWIIHQRHSVWWNYAILGVVTHFSAHTQQKCSYSSVHMTPISYISCLISFSPLRSDPAQWYTDLGSCQCQDELACPLHCMSHVCWTSLNQDSFRKQSFHMILWHICNIMIVTPSQCKCHTDWVDGKAVIKGVML